MNITVFAQEFLVSSATEHDVSMQFAPKFFGRFGYDARKIGEGVEFFAE